jgi:hypothetical protein
MGVTHFHFLSIEIKLGFYLRFTLCICIIAEMMALMKWFAVAESWRSLAERKRQTGFNLA